jgi:predicted nucleic acid-binding protein
MQHHPCGSATRRRPSVILDSQVFFDWAVFRNAAIDPLRLAIETGAVCWLGTPAMLNEVKHVLARGVFRSRNVDESGIALLWQRWVFEVEPAAAAPRGLRCRDTDDQMFIDLATAHGPCWLVSRDKAVLSLRRPLTRWGVQVLTPEAWALSWAEHGAPMFCPVQRGSA